ncbi:UNVERIFIED_ORG: XRE family transcriptional regulator [Bacillus sp. AZ43]
MGHFCGDRLRHARLAAGLTREDLAQQAGVRSADRVRDWERGAHAPQARYVPRLAAALGVDPVALYDVDPARPTLRVLRLARGLSLEQLAQLAGVPIMTCQRIEQGRGHRHDLTALNRVSRALGIPAGARTRDPASAGGHVPCNDVGGYHLADGGGAARGRVQGARPGAEPFDVRA